MPDDTDAVVATDDGVYLLDDSAGEVFAANGLEGGRPACVAAVQGTAASDVVAWCGTDDGGVFHSRDGVAWTAAGLEGRRATAVAIDPMDPSRVWVGTEPSAIWQSRDAGKSWNRMDGLDDLPSSSDWSFPPRPDTHHVRWITCHPADTDRLWVAIEAGALVATLDGGRTWRDRVPTGPYDTHELAIDPSATDHLHAAAGDGYFESEDGGATWRSPSDGLEAGYLVSVAVQPGDPTVVLVSAASHAHAAYRAGHSDGRLYRRSGRDPWEPVTDGWPDPPDTVAPLVRPVPGGGFLAADERGLHRSDDGGRSWTRVAGYPAPVSRVRGLAVLPARASRAPFGVSGRLTRD